MGDQSHWKQLWEQEHAKVLALETQNAALTRDEERFRMMFDHVPLGYMSMDENARLIDVNGAFADFFGYRRDEILGKAFAELLADGHDYHRSVTFPEFKRLGYSRDIEWTVRKKDGSEAVIQMSGNVRRDTDGRFIQTHCMMLDITEKRRAVLDLQEATYRERDRLGKDLHDGLGQQLTGIAYLATALEHDLRNTPSVSPHTADTAARIAETASDAVQAMRSVIQGLYPVPPNPEGLYDALKALAAETSGLGAMACLWLSREPDPIEDHSMAIHLFLIAREAVHNAVKHSQGTRIEIGLTWEQTTLVLRVADDGRGMRTDEPTPGTGIRNIRQRARLVGGTADWSLSLLGGTVLTCRVPRLGRVR